MTVLKKSVTGEKSLCALYKKRLLSTGVRAFVALSAVRTLTSEIRFRLLWAQTPGQTQQTIKHWWTAEALVIIL